MGVDLIDREPQSEHPTTPGGVVTIETSSWVHVIPRGEVRLVSIERTTVRSLADTSFTQILTYTLVSTVTRFIRFVAMNAIDDEINGATARMMMKMLTRGRRDARITDRGDGVGTWDVSYSDGDGGAS